MCVCVRVHVCMYVHMILVSVLYYIHLCVLSIAISVLLMGYMCSYVHVHVDEHVRIQ
jgi:hypothetical protein